ncbi:MAG: prepilin-type N-terminal cleavage/methylation domain-containing protein [Kiritimatiellia bacterium]|jgi:prepilin-type N-terminal cleavage/methylation domain-containing protein
MNRRNGMTLIELLVVLVIIAILVAIALGVLNSSRESTRRRLAEADISLFKLKLNDFRLDKDFIPTSAVIPAVPVDGKPDYTADPSDESYYASSRRLFLALSGRSTQALIETRDRSQDGKAYVRFKDLQVGDPEVNGGPRAPQYRDTYLDESFEVGSWLKDPWGHPYGFYFHESEDIKSIHGKAVFDVWSTAGEQANTPEARARWITSWQKK